MRSKNVQVSVVIPTYNRASYVTLAIESVLAQSYQDCEIVVVDDGSTDGTRDVLEPYRDRIRYLYQDNNGVSSARNAGIEEAKGKWIAFLDSDDEWLPDKLEIQMQQAQNYPHVCLHVANMLLINPQQGEIDYYHKIGFDKIIGKFRLVERPLIYLLQYTFAFPSTVVAKKSALLNARLFDEEISLHEDTDLFYRVSIEGPWCIYGSPLIKKFRRNEPSSINLSIKTAHQSYHYKTIVKIQERLQSEKRLTKTEHHAIKKYISRYSFIVGTSLKAEGTSGVRYWFYRGLIAYPKLKTFVKWILYNLPFGVDLIAPKLNASKNKDIKD